jgi:hypothetical protein
LSFKLGSVDVDVTILGSKNFQGTVAANREQPLGEVPFDGFFFLFVKPHECLLNDIAGTLQIPNDAVRILQEGALIARHRALNPFRFFVSFGFSEHRVFVVGGYVLSVRLT